MTIKTAPTAEVRPIAPRVRARAAFARLRRLVGMIAGTLFVASLVKELRTPKEQRAWHGTILGFVPYDLRPPTAARFKEVYWNTSSHRLVGGRVFGVGWGINLYELVARLQTVFGCTPDYAARSGAPQPIT